MKTKYQGKEYELLDLDDAVAELERQNAKGVRKAVVSVNDGYVVVDAIFLKGPSETEGEE